MSLEVSKFVVLRAKDLLMHLPRASRIASEEFVSICLAASKEFLRRKIRRGGGIAPSWLPPTSGGATPRSPRTASTAGGGAWGQLSERDEQLLRELLLGELALRLDHNPQYPGGSGVLEARNTSTPHAVASAPTTPRNSRQSHNKGSAANHGGGDGTGIAVPSRDHHHHNNTVSQHRLPHTSHLHPIQIESVQLIKEHIDPAYHRGSLTAEQYSTVVLSILREAFQHPQIAPLIDACCANPTVQSGGGGGGLLETHEAAVLSTSRAGDESAALGSDTDRSAPLLPTLLPPLLRSVLIDMATAVAQHYDLVAAAKREEAERLSHDARAAVGTHSPSIRPHHHHHHQNSTPRSSLVSDGANAGAAAQGSANPSRGSSSPPRFAEAPAGEAAHDVLAAVVGGGERSIARHIEEDEEEFNTQLAKLRAIMKDPPSCLPQRSSQHTDHSGGLLRSKEVLEAELDNLRDQLIVLQQRMMAVARELAAHDGTLLQKDC